MVSRPKEIVSREQEKAKAAGICCGKQTERYKSSYQANDADRSRPLGVCPGSRRERATVAQLLRMVIDTLRKNPSREENRYSSDQ